MKNKIIIGTVLAITTAVLLTGCIVVNVERTTPASSVSTGHTNTVAVPVAK